MYKVYFLDGYEITDVETVETTSARNINVYNSLGKGYFPVADDKDLKAWVIKCQQEDTRLFKLLDELLETKEESRLVICSDAENMSELVYLESYTKSEQNAGVFDVTIKFIEYVPVSVRTADVPYIPRPGRTAYLKSLPNKVVFDGKKNTPYKTHKKYMYGYDVLAPIQSIADLKSIADSKDKYMIWLAKNGKPYINIADIPNNEEITVKSELSKKSEKEFMATKSMIKAIKKAKENTTSFIENLYGVRGE